MFDFDIGKLMVVGIVALAVIPPKDLPRVMRTVGQFVGKMRRMAAEFQGQFMDAMREADLDSVKKELEALNDQAKINASFDPVAMIRDDVTKAAAPLDIRTSEVALNPPVDTAAHETPRVEAELETVRKELEALNDSARAGAPDASRPALPHPEAAAKAPGPSEAQAAAPMEAPGSMDAPAPKSSAAE
jgi:sec-independent protein translocase protein TatB